MVALEEGDIPLERGLEARVKGPLCQGMARMEIIDLQVHFSSSGQGSE